MDNTKAFETREQYLAFREAFRKLSREKKATSQTMMIFHTICGKGPYYGFSPIINPVKLASSCNGSSWHYHKNRIVNLHHLISGSMRWSIPFKAETNTLFGGTITDHAWDFLKEKISDAHMVRGGVK